MKLIVSVPGFVKFLFWLVAVVAWAGFAVGASGGAADHPTASDHSAAMQPSQRLDRHADVFPQ